VFGVGDSITDDTFKEDFEDPSSFFVDETGDTLDSATTSETTDGRFGDSLYPTPKSVHRSRRITFESSGGMKYPT